MPTVQELVKLYSTKIYNQFATEHLSDKSVRPKDDASNAQLMKLRDQAQRGFANLSEDERKEAGNAINLLAQLRKDGAKLSKLDMQATQAVSQQSLLTSSQVE